MNRFDHTFVRARQANPLQLAIAIVILILAMPVVIVLALLLGAIVVVLGALGMVAWSIARVGIAIRSRWPNNEGRRNVRVITRDQ